MGLWRTKRNENSEYASMRVGIYSALSTQHYFLRGSFLPDH